MMGGAKGQSDCVGEFITQDYTEDLKKISVPVLNPGFPHGMPVTHADTINADLLAFIKS
ncbi:MAG TPA: hypothetical protein VGH27_15600 [Streptosporangiaceae bacterium]|jgi:non-heme chloroperoxidase